MQCGAAALALCCASALCGPPLPVHRYTPEQLEYWRRQDQQQLDLQKQAAHERKAKQEADDAHWREVEAANAQKQKRLLYRSSYSAITSPEAAQAFIQQYAGDDPDNLTPLALQRGYTAAISEAKSCISFSQKTIEAEKEIGQTVGYVNKASLYQAGRNLLICRKDLARYQADAKKLGLRADGQDGPARTP